MTPDVAHLTVSALKPALGKITETLASEIARPSGATPEWTDVEWRIAEAVCALQGISAIVGKNLSWSGPRHWVDFIGEQIHHTLLRQHRIAELLEALDDSARKAGVGFVALKGSALLRSKVYDPGLRPMGDIDILAREKDLPMLAGVFEIFGYRKAYVSRRHITFEPHGKGSRRNFGEHIDHPINIELHFKIAEPLPSDPIDITDCILPNEPAPGLNSYPSQCALMRHLLLHSAGNIRARALRFVQLIDIALFAARLDRGEWAVLIANAHENWWAYPALALTRRYFDADIPDEASSALRSACPLLLRNATSRHRLTDVSWSRIQIQAFPGIEWSRSSREALRFASSRIVPSRQARAELTYAARVLDSAGSVPWYGQSHVVRILRWIFSRPPRVQTLYSVREALRAEA